MGNITVGGTGKTPLVEYIARYLQEKGKRVAILSRGYAASIKYEDRSLAKNVCNDEYLLFKENIPDIPNLLNKDRIKSGLEAVNRFKSEYLLLDDGFQHLRLERDLDIVIIDALNPFGHEQVIPLGTLREPLEALKRAGLFILTHTDQCDGGKVGAIINRLHEIAAHVQVIETAHKPTCLKSAKDNSTRDIGWLNGKTVFAFCAIGNPLSFRKSLEGLGADILRFLVFPDHHLYTNAELRRLNTEAKGVMPDAIITTQKDHVKIRYIPAMWDFPLWLLKMEIHITKGFEVFENKINAMLN